MLCSQFVFCLYYLKITLIIQRLQYFKLILLLATQIGTATSATQFSFFLNIFTMNTKVAEIGPPGYTL